MTLKIKKDAERKKDQIKRKMQDKGNNQENP